MTIEQAIRSRIAELDELVGVVEPHIQERQRLRAALAVLVGEKSPRAIETVRERVLAALSDGGLKRPCDMGVRTGNPATLYVQLNRMVFDGSVERVGQQYRLRGAA